MGLIKLDTKNRNWIREQKNNSHFISYNSLLHYKLSFYYRMKLKKWCYIHFFNEEHSHSTRIRRLRLIPPRSSETMGQRSQTYLAPHIYNYIPQYIKDSGTMNQFKLRLKLWITNQDWKYISDLIDIMNFRDYLLFVSSKIFILNIDPHIGHDKY